MLRLVEGEESTCSDPAGVCVLLSLSFCATRCLLTYKFNGPTSPTVQLCYSSFCYCSFASVSFGMDKSDPSWWGQPQTYPLYKWKGTAMYCIVCKFMQSQAVFFLDRKCHCLCAVCQVPTNPSISDYKNNLCILLETSVPITHMTSLTGIVCNVCSCT